MTHLLLLEGEQAAMRAVLASEPVPGLRLPAEGVLRHLVRLLDCDGAAIEQRDGAGLVVGSVSVGQHWPAGARDDVMVLAVATSNGEATRLTIARSRRRFLERDRALFALLTPALERLLRQRSWAVAPTTLTRAERRVLRHVAEGMSNAEIAGVLCVEPCTVRKHLEHAYRKLGVTNRVAALRALGAVPAHPGAGLQVRTGWPERGSGHR